MDNSCKVPEVKPITIKRFGTAGLVPTVPTTTDCNLWQKTDLKDGEFALNTVDDKLYIRSGNEIIELTNQSATGAGTVTSVGLNMPSAFSVANSPVTSSGTLVVTGAGTTAQYIRGDGSLATFPTLTGITSINSLTGAAQTLSTGTTGSDFNIVSTGTTHTFNIPTASSVNRGLLSSTDWSTFNNKVSTGAITSSGLTMATSRLLGRGTAGTGAVEEITIGSGLNLTGTTLSATGGITGLTANRFVYATSGTTVATDNNAYFDGTQIAFGTTSPIANTRTTILGSGTTSSTFGLQIHNSTGTNNSLTVRDDGFVGILTNAPINASARFTIGNSSTDYFEVFQGSQLLQRNINGITQNSILNQTDGSSSEVRHFLRNATGRELYISSTANSYTQSVLGSEGNCSVFYGKYTANVNPKMKFALSNSNSANQNQFEWISAVQTSTSISVGFGTTTPIMTLKGNGHLLIGTTTDVASSILTMESTSKGFLPPRMTTSEKNAIASPVAGLVVYDTTLNKLCVYTTAWETITSI